MTAPIETHDELPAARRWSDLAAELGYDGAGLDQIDDDNGDDTTIIEEAL